MPKLTLVKGFQGDTLMSTTTGKDPIEVAREIIEGKTSKVDEGLKKALETAKKEEKKEFEFEGKTFKVSDFDKEEKVDEVDDKKDSKKKEVEEAEDITNQIDDDGDSVKKAGDATTKMKHNKTNASDASAKQESIKLDIDSVVAEMVTKDESEDMVALFSGEDLTEDFKNKASIIFETAVKARVKDVVVALEEEANNKLEEITESQKAELTESIDEYLGYVVEEWVKENQVALDNGIKSDISESFMMGLKNLFEAHYIDMPDQKYDMVQEMQGKMEVLESRLNQEIQYNVDLKKNLERSHCSEIFASVSEGLTATQVEKLTTLAEGIEYDSPEQFAQKLGLIKESYFNKSLSSANVAGEEEVLNEENAQENVVYATPQMRNYAAAIGRQASYNKS